MVTNKNGAKNETENNKKWYSTNLNIEDKQVDKNLYWKEIHFFIPFFRTWFLMILNKKIK
jgi:hypothetical protein